MKIKLKNKFAPLTKYINKKTHQNLIRFFYYYRNNTMVKWGLNNNLIRDLVQRFKL